VRRGDHYRIEEIAELQPEATSAFASMGVSLIVNKLLLSHAVDGI